MNKLIIRLTSRMGAAISRVRHAGKALILKSRSKGLRRVWWIAGVAGLIALVIIVIVALPRPSPPPTPPPTLQPPPTLPPEIEKGLLILSHSTYVDTYGYFRVIGEVENIGKSNTEKNKITVTFYDEQGTLGLTGAGDCYLEIMKPGERSPFEIVFPSPPELKNYRLTAEWEVTDTQPNREMTFKGVKSSTDADGRYTVTGEIVNEGLHIIENAMVLCTFYDGSGKVVTVGFTFPDTLPIKPGNSSTFTLVVEPSVSSNIDKFSLQSEVQ